MTFKPTAMEETEDLDEMKEKWVKMTTPDGKIIPGFKVITEGNVNNSSKYSLYMTMGNYVQNKRNQTTISSEGNADFSKWVKIPNTLFRIHYSDVSGRVYMTLSNKNFALADTMGMTTSPTLSNFKTKWVEISNEKNYKVDYEGNPRIEIDGEAYQYINWGGFSVCIRGKDNKGRTILFNEKAVFEKARNDFFELLGDGTNIVQKDTLDLIKKLSYNDWGYEKELQYNTNDISSDKNYTVLSNYGCNVPNSALIGRNQEEVNRKCYPGRIDGTNFTSLSNSFDDGPNNNIPSGVTVMGVCGSGSGPGPTNAEWQSIRSYFMKLNGKLGGNRKYPIKYN